jgi:ABC-2 type transport system ATP-binding protein
VSIVVVEELHKRYGENHAVRGLSLSIEEGEVFAIVGPNGAGKTSTVEILEGHRTRTSGRVEVLGFDPQTGGRAYRERIGIVLQEAGMDERFTVRELVSLYAGFYPAPRGVDEVIELVGLTGKAGERTKTLSGGQRRRVDLALGLIGDPELLYLDEPTTGFDPSARRQAWDVVAGLCDIGKTVVLTTHYMEEAYRLADRVAVVARGELVALGTPEELVARTSAGRSVLTFLLPIGVSGADLPQLDGEVELDEHRVVVRSLSLTADLHTVTGWAGARGLELEGLALERGSFEDTYLELIGAGEPRG